MVLRHNENMAHVASTTMDATIKLQAMKQKSRRICEKKLSVGVDDKNI